MHTFPPTATPWLYSQQLWSESANHSQVSLPQPDLAKQPLFARALPMRETFTVEAGDALFIPCGWWHQIDSPGTTIAVNFWWSAPACEAAQSPAAAFLLRESLRSLTHSHMTALLSQVQPVPAMKTDSVADGDESGEAALQLQPRSASEAQLLQQLLHPPPSHAWHDGQDAEAEPTAATKRAPPDPSEADADWLAAHAAMLLARCARLEDDTHDTSAGGGAMGLQAPATRILSMLTAPQAKTALQALMGAAGKTCADLLLHRLPPAAAELLTRHFEADEGTPGGAAADASFYQQLYSLFEAPEALFARLLDLKETFAAYAYQEVLRLHLEACPMQQADQANWICFGQAR